jgi:DNA-binding transcriptional ArsR family regulator
MPDQHIAEPDLVKALAHPLRVRILNYLEQRTASPKQLAAEFDIPLGTVSYHVRALSSLGLLRLVARKPRRGAVEHYYRAELRPVISDDGWGAAPKIVKDAMIQSSLSAIGDYVETAAQTGGFDRGDIHLSRTTFEVDAEAWAAASQELTAVFERIRRLADETTARLAESDDDEKHEIATIVMMLFESGSPDEEDAHAAAHRSQHRKRERERAAAALPPVG